ncbi:MAG TPA: hypothetical protein VI318_04485 [Baekduia sp.]
MPAAPHDLLHAPLARRARFAAAVATVALGVLAAGASAAGAAPIVTVAGDSVIVTGQAAGATTVQATRPDAVTGQPVVIGQYAATASAFLPFSVNTTVATPLDQNGDCWQKGALASAVTPDLLPGDTVSVSQTPLFGAPVSASTVVSAQSAQGGSGPIPDCASSAPYAHNALTSVPGSVAGGSLAVAGVAQPFASSVSVTAGDGTTSTAPVSATPAQDGTWSATIPASAVAGLHAGTLTVTPVYTVPDVSTGATAHISAGSAQLTKSAAAGGKGSSGGGSGSPSGSGGSSQGAAGGSGGSRGSTTMRVRSIGVPARTRIGTLHRSGLRVSFVVPAGAKVIRVRLDRGSAVLTQRLVGAARAGTRQVVRLSAASLRHSIRRAGTFSVSVSAGPRRNDLGPPVVRRITVR